MGKLRVLGCLVFVHEHGHTRKLNPKAVSGIFVGYSRKANAYLALVGGKVRTVRDLVFDEKFEHAVFSKKMKLVEFDVRQTLVPNVDCSPGPGFHR